MSNIAVDPVPPLTPCNIAAVDSDSDYGVDVELTTGAWQEDLPDANMSGTDGDSDGGVDVALDAHVRSGAAAAPLLFFVAKGI